MLEPPICPCNIRSLLFTGEPPTYYIEILVLCAQHMYCINHLKRRRFVASYVQPIIQQYKSTTVLKSTFAIKEATMKITDDFH